MEMDACPRHPSADNWNTYETFVSARYGDLTGIYVTEMSYVLAPGFSLPELPAEVPALAAQPRPLPADNDLDWNLDLDNPDSAPTYQSSAELRDDLGPAGLLVSSSQAVEVAEVFLREINLLVDDLLPPAATAGSSTTQRTS
jgi:hypothetical protein